MKLSNDVEKYEIEVTKMGQNYSFFLTVVQFGRWHMAQWLKKCVHGNNLVKLSNMQ